MDINNFKLIYARYLFKDKDHRYNFVARSLDLWCFYCKKLGRLIIEDKVNCVSWDNEFQLVVKKIIRELK